MTHVSILSDAAILAAWLPYLAHFPNLSKENFSFLAAVLGGQFQQNLRKSDQV